MITSAGIEGPATSRTKRLRLAPLAAATLTCSALLVATPPSRADAPAHTSGPATSCPDVQVVFARDAFSESLRSLLGGKSVAVYGVRYPASYDFMRAVDGVDDAGVFN
jgi:cutinase